MRNLQREGAGCGSRRKGLIEMSGQLGKVEWDDLEAAGEKA